MANPIKQNECENLLHFSFSYLTQQKSKDPASDEFVRKSVEEIMTDM
jgi:hypothetical protein